MERLTLDRPHSRTPEPCPAGLRRVEVASQGGPSGCCWRPQGVRVHRESTQPGLRGRSQMGRQPEGPVHSTPEVQMLPRQRTPTVTSPCWAIRKATGQLSAPGLRFSLMRQLWPGLPLDIRGPLSYLTVAGQIITSEMMGMK